MTANMLAQKTFLKKTRRGKVIKVVREHYLRDDLPCGILDFHKDLEPVTLENLKHSSYLDAKPESHCKKFEFPHFVVIDTNVVLGQIDVLEAEGLTNVIVLQTVLQEVRNRSSPIYKRIRDLLADPKRKFFLFINDHHKDTYAAKKPLESPNDRCDRAIRVACQWYESHTETKVVLITEDAANRKLAADLGLATSSISEYVKAMPDFPLLTDKLSVKSDNDLENKKAIYPEHLSPSQINEGIRSKKIHRGVFYLSRTNYLEGTINCEAVDKPVLIQGLECQNRAVDGDSVAFVLLPKKEWKGAAEVVLEDEGADAGDVLEDDVLESAKKSSEVQPTGRVVGIIKRKWRQYCGMLQPNLVSGTTRHIFVPAEKKIPKIRIETRQASNLASQRIIVAIDSWPRHSRYPQGHFVRALGKVGDKATENEVLLLEHDIPHSKFSEAVLDCLPKLPWVITPQDEAVRVDCRHLDICSVDPPGCTDIDDALHCRKLDNGNLEVGVHIADVGHFIRPNTPIDKEAANRSTTVYLTDRRIDMVPELLSSNLCSLRGGVERFSFSCVWEMTTNAEIVSTKFHKSIIKSRAAMTYEEAQNRIDDPNDDSAIANSLRNLLKLSKILKKRRMDNGALVLASSEIRFNVDSETADPIDVQVKTIRETNSMVEEFMLAANISAAEKIFGEFPDCAMLRRHPAPPPSNFDALVKAGKQQGFDIKLDSGKDLADSLDAAVDSKNPYFNTMLRMIATRCMMQAVYFASGTLEEPLFMHYGLACPIYTHFTSPIRRYADVIVHRLLAAAIGADSTYPELLDKKETQKIANNINYRHRMAQYASRASVNLHTHLFFRNRERTEDGYILFVRQNAIQVLIPKYGLEGTLYLRSDGVEFVFDEDEPSQTCNGVKLGLFMKVKVSLSLDTSNVQHEKLVLKLVEPVIEGFSVAGAADDDDEDVTEVVEEVKDDSKAKKRKGEGEEGSDGSNKKKRKKKGKK